MESLHYFIILPFRKFGIACTIYIYVYVKILNIETGLSSAYEEAV